MRIPISISYKGTTNQTLIIVIGYNSQDELPFRAYIDVCKGIDEMEDILHACRYGAKFPLQAAVLCTLVSGQILSPKLYERLKQQHADFFVSIRTIIQ